MKILRKKAYKYRLKPNKEQRIKFAQFAGCTRFIFNHFLHKVLQALKDKTKMPSYYDAAMKLPFMKALEETKWLSDVLSQVLQQAIKHLYFGIAQYFEKRKENPSIRLPKFKKKGKKNHLDILRISNAKMVKSGFPRLDGFVIEILVL